KMGPVKISGDVLGGSGASSGNIFTSSNLTSLTIGGSLVAGTGSSSGQVDVTGGSGAITIGKNIAGNASVLAEIQVRGNNAVGAKPSIAITSLTVGGRVDHALIVGGSANNSFDNPDAQIGAVKVGGDWIDSNLVAGAKNVGADGADGGGDDNINFGDTHDAVMNGTNDAQVTSKIASITIGGHVSGTAGGSDHFGFVSQEIGSFKVAGTAFNLTPGPSNDTSTSSTQLVVGVTGDVTIHEV